jgi:hypothetical protein
MNHPLSSEPMLYVQHSLKFPPTPSYSLLLPPTPSYIVAGCGGITVLVFKQPLNCDPAPPPRVYIIHLMSTQLIMGPFLTTHRLGKTQCGTMQ